MFLWFFIVSLTFEAETNKVNHESDKRDSVDQRIETGIKVVHWLKKNKFKKLKLFLGLVKE